MKHLANIVIFQKSAFLQFLIKQRFKMVQYMKMSVNWNNSGFWFRYCRGRKNLI